MSNTPHEIWCLVEGEDISFPVLVPLTVSIDELKETIQKKIGTALPAYKLILWRVRYFYSFVLTSWVAPL